MAIVAHFFTPKHKKSITPAHNPANVMLLMEWSWRGINPKLQILLYQLFVIVKETKSNEKSNAPLHFSFKTCCNAKV